jgi:hypothetical protein
MRPLGAAKVVENVVAIATVTPATEPQAKGPPPVRYAAVAERDRDGIVTRLALPGPTAGGRVALMSEVAGGWIRTGWVESDGTVRPAPDLAPDLPPGVKLLAPTDPRGRVVLIQALMQAPRAAPAKLARRSAPPPPRRAATGKETWAPGSQGMTADGELFYSGHAGSVLRVR